MILNATARTTASARNPILNAGRASKGVIVANLKRAGDVQTGTFAAEPEVARR